MKKLTLLLFLIIICQNSYSQKLLTSWSQQNIENYTREMYDEAQKLTTSELLLKNTKDNSWSSVFLTLNASINNYKEDTDYLKELAKQITNIEETKLKGTSRLIIWDRIISGDIIFEGKGLIIYNDLFKVGGRANQILQNLTNKNFGYVNINTTNEELENLKNKWLDFLTNKTIEEFKPTEYPNAKIPEISSLTAVEALVVSLQANATKDAITKNCLKNVYNLDEMPKEKGSSASYCNPDTYTFAYLRILFGYEEINETKDAKWWLNFWTTNQDKLVWNNDLGIYEVSE
ncbi:hypothetical protein SAMN03080601_03572 [Alkalitalea saponilacus]|uniref:Uncharacterized protein n=2 Tax=Alkalitalea saponilacus TaxID=889453 RepID=A0A1T5HUD5_9BACT|nr:hypothetical protein [Alkalitalea saponilacus]SKC24275.1 hypothetical protein SAMN03080601_03572 [Alkalitalea saponilacus]